MNDDTRSRRRENDQITAGALGVLGALCAIVLVVMNAPTLAIDAAVLAGLTATVLAVALMVGRHRERGSGR